MINVNNTQEVAVPLVSICCFAYNQEKYISQTLESLLMQRTTFPYEILVHDDASSDNTREIIEEYAFNYPQIIRPIYQKKNKYSIHGMSYIFRHVTLKAEGKYIAICAGDDFWIDPLKLKKQVEFLELNSDYGLVHTKAVKFFEVNGEFRGSHGARVDDLESLLAECSIAALTVCLRNSLLKQYQEEIKPQEHKKWTTEDFPIWIWCLRHSKFKFLEDYTAVYRVNLGSISHIKDDIKRLHFSEGVYDIVNYYLHEYAPIKNAEKIRARYYSGMIKMYLLARQWDGIRESIKIFYVANDWLNIFWLTATLPFVYSDFMIKVSYKVRAFVFNIFNLYPIRN